MRYVLSFIIYAFDREGILSSFNKPRTIIRQASKLLSINCRKQI